MSNFPSPAGWSPPGAQFRSGSAVGRTLTGIVIGLVATPIGIGLAATGAADIRQWTVYNDASARWSSTAEIAVGAALLFLVAALAAYSPAGTLLAGLLWGVLPGVMYVFLPEGTWRLIQEDLPGLSAELRQALHTWVSNGYALVTGLLLIGSGIAATLRRR